MDYDIGHGKHGALDTGRQADLHNLSEGFPINPQRLPFYMDILPGNPQTPEQQHRADCVGNYRGNCDPVDCHMQDSHKEQIQDNIQHAGGCQCNQRYMGISHAAENCCLEVIQQNDGHSQQIDSQIEQRRSKHVVRHMERRQQRGCHKFTDCSHQNAPQERCHDRSMDRFFHRLPVIPPHCVGNDHIGAQGDSHKQIDNQSNNRTVGSHRRHSHGLSRAGEIAYHRNIGCIEQLFQDGGCRYREGKQRQLVPDGPMQHIKLPLRFSRIH